MPRPGAGLSYFVSLSLSLSRNLFLGTHVRILLSRPPDSSEAWLAARLPLWGPAHVPAQRPVRCFLQCVSLVIPRRLLSFSCASARRSTFWAPLRAHAERKRANLRSMSESGPWARAYLFRCADGPAIKIGRPPILGVQPRNVTSPSWYVPLLADNNSTRPVESKPKMALGKIIWGSFTAAPAIPRGGSGEPPRKNHRPSFPWVLEK